MNITQEQNNDKIKPLTENERLRLLLKEIYNSYHLNDLAKLSVVLDKVRKELKIN